MECGPHDALIAAEELEIGVYRLAMETPLACSENNLEEAQYQLELHGVSVEYLSRVGIRLYLSSGLLYATTSV